MNSKDPEYVTDPAQLGIFRALVEAFLDEMGETLRHGAFSQNIKERRDYSCALFNRNGDLVCGAAHIPVHLGSMDTACKAAIESVDMNPGDGVVLNDPFSGGTHLPDITIIIPAFLSDEPEPEFFIGVRAHHADVGGIAPGSLPLSKNLSDEGLVIPPILIAGNGRIIESIVEKIATHSRQPDERRGDIRAQIASGLVGLRRLEELKDKRGLDRMLSESGGLIGHSESTLHRYLETRPTGSGTGSVFMDEIDDESGALIHCSIELGGNPKRLVIDFTDSSDRHPGCLNATPAIVRSAVLYTLRLFLPPDTPTTSGLLNPVDIRLRKGSVLDPPDGSAVAGGNVETSQAIVEALLLAFGELGWDVPASSQGTMNNVLLGSAGESGGEGYSFYETIGGGAGASANSDGASAIQTHMTNTRNTPVEVLERTYPLRVRRYAIRRGSGGNGLKKGGDGIIREFEILEDSRLTILSHHRCEGPPGANGGCAGKPGENILISDGNEEMLPSRIMTDLRPGDIIRIKTPGGGGYGSAG